MNNADSGSESSGVKSNIRRKSSGESEKWRGIVLFIPVRLGGEKFNPVYTDCVKAIFAQPTTLGKCL